MLTESQVIDRLCKHLESAGWRINQRLNETERGHDIIATGPKGKQLFVEAKGETSSKPTTARHGMPFSRGQVRDHVAVALLKAVTTRAQQPRAYVGMAFPDNRNHRELSKPLLGATKKLGIRVYYVKEDGVVCEE